LISLRRAAPALLVVLAGEIARAGFAAPVAAPVTIRTGEHAGFGRLVLDSLLPYSSIYRLICRVTFARLTPTDPTVPS
jgi:hypothetical protein